MRRFIETRRRLLFAAATALGLTGCGSGGNGDSPPPPPPPAPPRPYRLGVTRWPPDLTLDAVAAVDRFIADECDFVAPMLLGGVPWPEAFAGSPFSANLAAELAYRKPAGYRMLVSTTPLNANRSGMALYWGTAGEQQLPAPWNTLALNSAEVKTAFTNYARRIVDTMQPDVLAIGIEHNVLLTATPALWPALKELHRYVYDALKQQYPQLPVCFTIEALHLLGFATGSNATTQRTEVLDLLRHSDLVAISVYPHMSLGVPHPLPATFFDFAADLARDAGNKPIAISESGMTSRDTTVFGVTLRGTEAEQHDYMEKLLAAAERDRYSFVVNFASHDFEPLVARLPPDAQELAKVWVYTGLKHSDGAVKPVMDTWRSAKTRVLQP